MLDASGLEPREIRSTTGATLDERDAESLLRSVETVVLGRGRSIERRPASDTAVSDLLGPTGKVRAPMLVVGDTLLVGLQLDALAELAG